MGVPSTELGGELDYKIGTFRQQLLSCVKVKVAVLGSPFLTVLMVCGRKATLKNRAQELCESRGGRPGLVVSVDVKQP